MWGATSAKQSKDLAGHAQKAGAYAVGTMGPVFLKPTRVEELVGFCAEVASGAPDLPFYYYHIPSVSGIELSMIEFIRKAALHIPNFSGIKFTHNNFMEMQQCLHLDNGKWDILHGFDESRWFRLREMPVSFKKSGGEGVLQFHDRNE